MMMALDKPNFAAAWEQLEEGHESTAVYDLTSVASIEEAVMKITEFLGMHPCEKSGVVKADKHSHSLYLSV